MGKLWTIWADGFGEVNAYYLDNYDAVLRVVQDELDDGYFDLDDILIEELEFDLHGQCEGCEKWDYVNKYMECEKCCELEEA